MDKRNQMIKSKIRAPMQEVILPDFPDDDNTITTTVTKSRRVSFGTNFVKEFIVGSAVSAQCVSEYEQAFSSSDSSNPNSSHSGVESGILSQNTYVLEESHKSKPPELEENRSIKRPKISSTICFTADSPTADMEFTEGCISLAKSILDKKNKEMTVIIQAKPKESKEEKKINKEDETKYFEGSQIDMSLVKSFCVKENRKEEKRCEGEKTKVFGVFEDEMSFTNADKIFKKRQSTFSVGDETDESWDDDSSKENKMPLNLIIHHLDRNNSDLESSLFHPQLSLSDALKSSFLNNSNDSEKVNLNESSIFQMPQVELDGTHPTVSEDDVPDELQRLSSTDEMVEQAMKCSEDSIPFEENEESKMVLSQSTENIPEDLCKRKDGLDLQMSGTEEVLQIARNEVLICCDDIQKNSEKVNEEEENEEFEVFKDKIIEVNEVEANMSTQCSESDKITDEFQDFEVDSDSYQRKADVEDRINVPKVEDRMNVPEVEENNDLEECTNANEKPKQPEIHQLTAEQTAIEDPQNFEMSTEKINAVKEIRNISVSPKNTQEVSFNYCTPEISNKNESLPIFDINEVLSTEKECTQTEKEDQMEVEERDQELMELTCSENQGEIMMGVSNISMDKEMMSGAKEEVTKNSSEAINEQIMSEEISKNMKQTSENNIELINEKDVEENSLENKMAEKKLELINEKDVEEHSSESKVEEQINEKDKEEEYTTENKMEELINEAVAEERIPQKNVAELINNEGLRESTFENKVEELVSGKDVEEQINKNNQSCVMDLTEELPNNLVPSENVVEAMEVDVIEEGDGSFIDQNADENYTSKQAAQEASLQSETHEEEADEIRESPPRYREPFVVDRKVIENLEEQSKEPGCTWTLKEVVHPQYKANGLLSCSFDLLESKMSFNFRTKRSDEDTLGSCSFICGGDACLNKENELKVPDYWQVLEFGFEKLKQKFEEEQKTVKTIRQVPYFLDQMNLFNVKINSCLRQIYSVLTLYPGSTLEGSKLSFRLFSFPILFSWIVSIDLQDLTRLSRSSISFDVDFGDLDKNKISEIFQDCTQRENAICEFIIRSTEHIVDLERKTGCRSKRHHIKLLPKYLTG